MFVFGRKKYKKVVKQIVYEFEGGSGFIKQSTSAKNCHVRCKTHPAKEVMEGMVGIPLGIFDTAKSLSPKAEIWSRKATFFENDDDCVSLVLNKRQ